MGSAVDGLLHLVPVVLLVSIRVGVAMAAMPAPFGDLAPKTIRAALGVMISLAIAIPNVDSVPLPVDASVWEIGRASVGELLVGLVIGVTVRCTIAAADIAGTFAGFSMGLGFAGTVDPALGEMASAPARLMHSFAALVFIVMQGHHIVLGALAESLRVAPPGHAFGVVAHEGVIHIGSQMLTNGLRIAAPVVGTMFIVQLGMGLVSRAAPKVQIFALSFGIASGVGMVTLFVAAPSVATAIGLEVQRLPHALADALGGP